MVEQSHITVTNPNPEVTPSQGDICRHHWIIETPNGPTSNGTCKNCGDERPFVNYKVDESYQRHFRGELDLTRKQEGEYYRETGANPKESGRIPKSILPKNGTIGGR